MSVIVEVAEVGIVPSFKTSFIVNVVALRVCTGELI